MNKLPFMSVVVSTWNGEAGIGRTIESVLSLDYPKDRFEMIIVDDGSTDRTAEIVKHYPVKYYYQRHAGVASGRNTGLNHASGDIYVAIDDDCVLKSDYLQQLARIYQTRPDAVGVGGMIGEFNSKKLINAYIIATDTGPAAKEDAARSASTLSRLFNYLRQQFSVKNTFRPTTPQNVVELFGATSSFPISVLKSVDGWDPATSPGGTGIEDRDLSRRIIATYPGHTFVCVPAATIFHDPHTTVYKWLVRSYKRGPVYLAFHLQNNLTPPIFPFPIMTLLLTLAALAISPIAAILVFLIMPQLLYAKWILRFAKMLDPRILVFPYIQMGEEAAVITGLAKGFLQLRRHHV